MRLTDIEKTIIKAEAKNIFGPGTKIPLAARGVLDAINEAYST